MFAARTLSLGKPPSKERPTCSNAPENSRSDDGQSLSQWRCFRTEETSGNCADETLPRSCKGWYVRSASAPKKKKKGKKKRKKSRGRPGCIDPLQAAAGDEVCRCIYFSLLSAHAMFAGRQSARRSPRLGGRARPAPCRAAPCPRVPRRPVLSRGALRRSRRRGRQTARLGRSR